MIEAEARGRIVRGLRSASGASRRMRRGTIALQLPHFRALLPEFDAWFDGPLHRGTLNVAVPGRSVEVRQPSIRVPDVRWERDTAENFYLSPCVLRFSGKDYRGLIYIPDPETKPGGLPVGRVLEVLTSRVPFIRYGSPVTIAYDAAAIGLVRQRRAPASADGYGQHRRSSRR
jgi:hypothetical protein